jgi:hypothetical protein
LSHCTRAAFSRIDCFACGIAQKHLRRLTRSGLGSAHSTPLLERNSSFANLSSLNPRAITTAPTSPNTLKRAYSTPDLAVAMPTTISSGGAAGAGAGHGAGYVGHSVTPTLEAQTP